MISVVINAYNAEKYIKKCLESVINQTYKDIEILIINDGSTDNTLKICKSYKDERIRIVNSNHMGLSLSRNKGIDESNGEYIYFIDADDYIENDTIELLYNMIKIDNTKIATCNTYDVINGKIITNEKDDNTTKVITGLDLLKKVLLSIGRNGTIWNKLIHKSLFKDIRFEDRIINDVVVTYKLLLSVDNISYSTSYKYFYVKHEGSIMARNNSDRAIDLYNASIERYDYIKNIYPNLIENDICLLSMITTIYAHKDKKVNDYLINNKAKEYYKKLLTLKVLFYKYSIKEKIKMVLFRISPELFLIIISFYLKITNK